MRMGELRSLYSGARNSYAYLTFVAHDLVAPDWAYRGFLNPRADASSSGGFESGQSIPSVEQMLPRVHPPRGPSRLSSKQAPPTSDDEGSASRRRRRK